MDQKKPNKPNKRKKPSSTETGSTPMSNDQIKTLLKEVISKSLEEKELRKDIDLDALAATIEEFLRCYILIGYDVDNEPVFLMNANTQLDADALHTAMSKLFFSMNGGGGGA